MHMHVCVRGNMITSCETRSQHVYSVHGIKDLDCLLTLSPLSNQHSSVDIQTHANPAMVAVGLEESNNLCNVYRTQSLCI